jgi:hypothetical protein
MSDLSPHPYPSDFPARQYVYGKDVASGPNLTKVSVKVDTDVDVIDLEIAHGDPGLAIDPDAVQLSPDKAIRIAQAIFEMSLFARRSQWEIPSLCKGTVTVRRIDSTMIVVVLGMPVAPRQPVRDVQVLLEHRLAANLALHLIDAARFITNVANGFWDPEDSSTWDRVCRSCGCSDESACPSGCAWVESNLCSACAPLCGECGASAKDMGEALARPRGRKGRGKR